MTRRAEVIGTVNNTDLNLHAFHQLAGLWGYVLPCWQPEMMARAGTAAAR